jgi:hypothetical protein
MTAKDPDALETVHQARTPFEAEVLVSALRDAGLDAHAFSASFSSIPVQAGWNRIPVQVPARQADEARAAIATMRPAHDREDGEHDDAPAKPRSMPVVARVGFLLAALIIALMVVVGVVILVT